MIRPERHPADADRERARVERHHHDPGGEGAEAAEHGGERHLEAEGAEVERRLPGALGVAVVAAQLDHRDVGDREGEHRAEGVHRRQEVGLARDQGDHRDRGEDEDRDVGGAVARVDLAQALGQLAVLAHRVGEAGDADQAGVGGDQQDHRGEDADVEAQRFGRARASPRFSTMPRIGSLANSLPSAVM